jgi:hypothetical protein
MGDQIESLIAFTLTTFSFALFAAVTTSTWTRVFTFTLVRRAFGQVGRRCQYEHGLAVALFGGFRKCHFGSRRCCSRSRYTACLKCTVRIA